MEASESLLVANELSGRPSEAFQRSALSRIYYAVHHEAAMFVQRDNDVDLFSNSCGGRVNRHQRVAELLTLEAVRAGEMLHELRRMRNAADYEIHAQWADGHVQEAWVLAGHIRRRLGTQ